MTDVSTEAAFFVGKLNKTHNRSQIYSALRSLGKRYNFYIKKLDMPYGDKQTKRGNKGYCFVYCRNKAEADRIVALHYIQLGSQKCEVKTYGGKDIDTFSDTTSGVITPAETNVAERDITADLQLILNRKCFSGAQIVSSWAEESENPEGYYSECSELDDVEAVQTSRLVEVQPAACEVAAELQDSSTESETVDFVQLNFLKATSNGKGSEFLQAYLEAFEAIQSNMSVMSPDDLREFAQGFIPLLTKFS